MPSASVSWAPNSERATQCALREKDVTFHPQIEYICCFGMWRIEVWNIYTQYFSHLLFQSLVTHILHRFLSVQVSASLFTKPLARPAPHFRACVCVCYLPNKWNFHVGLCLMAWTSVWQRGAQYSTHLFICLGPAVGHGISFTDRRVSVWAASEPANRKGRANGYASAANYECRTPPSASAQIHILALREQQRHGYQLGATK